MNSGTSNSKHRTPNHKTAKIKQDQLAWNKFTRVLDSYLGVVCLATNNQTAMTECLYLRGSF